MFLHMQCFFSKNCILIYFIKLNLSKKNKKKFDVKFFLFFANENSLSTYHGL